MSNKYQIKTRNIIAKDLEPLIKLQCSTGNWNYDPYMWGFANGLILAHATILGIEPKYLEAPEVWLKDKPYSTGMPIMADVDTTVVKKGEQNEP